jgi:hypothetical protein
MANTAEILRLAGGSSHIDAATQGVIENVGAWVPENAIDLDLFLAQLPQLFEALASSIAGVAERLASEFPVDPAVPEHLQEIAATVAGMGEFAGEAHGIHRTAHAAEMERIENPKPGGSLWDINATTEGGGVSGGEASQGSEVARLTGVVALSEGGAGVGSGSGSGGQPPDGGETADGSEEREPDGPALVDAFCVRRMLGVAASHPDAESHRVPMYPVSDTAPPVLRPVLNIEPDYFPTRQRVTIEFDMTDRLRPTITLTPPEGTLIGYPVGGVEDLPEGGPPRDAGYSSITATASVIEAQNHEGKCELQFTGRIPGTEQDVAFYIGDANSQFMADNLCDAMEGTFSPSNLRPRNEGPSASS